MFNRKTPVAVLKSGFVVSKASQYLVPPQMLKLLILDVQCVLA